MLKQRIITALILAPLVLAGVFLLPPVEFTVFVAGIILIGAWEWADLAGFEGYGRIAFPLFLLVPMILAYFITPVYVLLSGVVWWLVALYLVINYKAGRVAISSRWIKGLIGVFLLVPLWISLIWLKQRPDSDYLIVLLFFLIWGADIGAYFTGRAFGTRKLAPEVSPGKSWAGAFGGLATATTIAVLMGLWAGFPEPFSDHWFKFLGACSVVVAVSVLGDLTESMFKRERGVKDSSGLLPGHGGVLDRVDSLLAAGPFFALFVLIFQWQ